jgi:hypothetical protein
MYVHMHMCNVWLNFEVELLKGGGGGGAICEMNFGEREVRVKVTCWASTFDGRTEAGREKAEKVIHPRDPSL